MRSENFEDCPQLQHVFRRCCRACFCVINPHHVATVRYRFVCWAVRVHKGWGFLDGQRTLKTAPRRIPIVRCGRH